MMRLLYPFLCTLRNRFFPKGGWPAKTLVVVFFGLFVCFVLYFISVKVVEYFHSQNELGVILSLKIFQMAWLIMFAMLVFSSMVSSVSTIFLSRDNEIIAAAPLPPAEIYFMRYVTTTMYTSWMMVVFSLPVFAAYGTVFQAGFWYWPLMLFSVLCAALVASGCGMGFSVVLVTFFPARQTKDIIFYLSLCFGIFIYILFRMLRPEDLVNPDQYSHFVEYLSAISQPAGPYVPAAWASNLLSLYLLDRKTDWLLVSLLLFSVPSVFILGEWAMQRFFFSAFSKSQQSFGGFRTFTHQSQYRPGVWRWIFQKESKVFLRDSAEWSQLFMVAALVVVYLYSFKALPVDRSPFKPEYITNLISFLNVGLTGFIITSLAARFVFPSIGGEGGAFWLISSASLSINRFLLYKFFFYAAPFTLLALLLVITSNSLLQISGPMWWFSLIAILLVCWAVVGMAVAFGAMHADFKVENRAAALGTMGALLYLFWAMTVTISIIFSGSYPMYHLVKGWLLSGQLQKEAIGQLVAWLFFSLLLGAGSVYFFWRKGCRALRP